MTGNTHYREGYLGQAQWQVGNEEDGQNRMPCTPAKAKLLSTEASQSPQEYSYDHR